MGLGRELPPDLPLLFEGSPKVGLGLYNSVPVALITEFGLFIAGIAIYLSTTRARDRVGRWSFWLLILFVFLMMVPGIVPDLALLPTFATVLLLPLGNWVDRHRISDRERVATATL
jgi:ABC-type Fe3+ transport system permease subunit